MDNSNYTVDNSIDIFNEETGVRVHIGRDSDGIIVMDNFNGSPKPVTFIIESEEQAVLIAESLLKLYKPAVKK